MVVYDVSTKNVAWVVSPKIDSSTFFDFTEWSLGSFPGVVELGQSAPINTPPNSGFTGLTPAHELFDIIAYPVRTAVQIFRFIGDSLAHHCSGTMVSKNLVLTSAHCVFLEFDNRPRQFRDSVLIAPAFDNGQIQRPFGSSVSKKILYPQNLVRQQARNMG
jgi:hypothetical protein